MQINEKEFSTKLRPFLLILALALFMSFCLDLTNNSLRIPAFWGMLAVFVILCIAFFGELTSNTAVCTMVIGAFVKASYVLYTPVWERQHDVVDFGAGEGHAAYIEYILYNRSLPDFDPRSVWSFFQPPLHHFISAAWMWINIRFKIAERRLYENVQILPLCYILIMTLIVYFICRELSLSEKATFVTMLIVSFHPIYILLSGSINNDALALVLSAFSIYMAIIWYKKPALWKLLLLAASIGLAMMAKLSSALVAPAIGVMILYKMITDIKAKKSKITTCIGQLAAFAIVVFPLGLWWPVRNLIRWNMPINYIPEVGEQLTRTGIFSRIFDLRTGSVYPAMIVNGDSYDEYNVILAMFKTSFFGECNYSSVSGKITPFAYITFIFGVILAITGVIATVYLCVKKEALKDMGMKILLCGTFICLMGGYFVFALSYNNFSAQDFRYSALAIAIEAVFTGMLYDRLGEEGRPKLFRILIKASSVIFAFGAFGVYMLLGLYTVR